MARRGVEMKGRGGLKPYGVGIWLNKVSFVCLDDEIHINNLPREAVLADELQVGAT